MNNEELNEKQSEEQNHENQYNYENKINKNLLSIIDNNRNQIQQNDMSLNKQIFDNDLLQLKSLQENNDNNIEEESSKDNIINISQDNNDEDEENDIIKNNYNKNNMLDEMPFVSLINSNHNIYNYSNNFSNYYLRRHSLDNSRTLRKFLNNINPNKEIIYNFGYKKKDRLEPLKLNLIKDTIEEQEKEYERKKKEKETLRKQLEDLNSKKSQKKNNLNSEKNIHTKKYNNLDTNNNYEYLSKLVEQELNLTNKQMNILDKEVNNIYDNYKKSVREKNKMLKANKHSGNNKFLSNRGKYIINKDINKSIDKNNNNKNKNKGINVPIPLLMSCMIENNKRDNMNLNGYYYENQRYFYSPKENYGFNYLHNYSDNQIIKGKKLIKNYSQMYQNKKFFI